MLLELSARLRVIDSAACAAEERRDRVVALARRIEAAEADAALLARLRLQRLRSANATLERLCVLRQARKDLDFLCSGVAALFEKDFDAENEEDEESDPGERVPLVAARLSSVGGALGRLRPLPPPEEEFDVERWRREVEEEDDNIVVGRRLSRDDSYGADEPRQRHRLKVCFDASSPLYEKVLCRLPFVVVEAETGRRVDDEGEDGGEAMMEGLR